MLTACVSSAAKPSPNSPAPDPVVEIQHEVRLVCPDELTTPLPVRPPVPADAVVNANPSGAAWLADDMIVAASVRGLFEAARAQCPAEKP